MCRITIRKRCLQLTKTGQLRPLSLRATQLFSATPLTSAATPAVTQTSAATLHLLSDISNISCHFHICSHTSIFCHFHICMQPHFHLLSLRYLQPHLHLLSLPHLQPCLHLQPHLNPPFHLPLLQTLCWMMITLLMGLAIAG